MKTPGSITPDDYEIQGKPGLKFSRGVGQIPTGSAVYHMEQKGSNGICLNLYVLLRHP